MIVEDPWSKKTVLDHHRHQAL